MRTILFSLLLYGLTMAVEIPNQKSPDGPISVDLGDVFKKGNAIV